LQRAKRLSLIPPDLFGEIARVKEFAAFQGQNLLDLAAEDSDLPIPQSIVSQLQAFALDPSTHRYEAGRLGRPEFLRDVAAWFASRFDVELDPETEILELIGAKEGLAHLVWAFIDPGDAALVPDPGASVVKTNTILAGGVPHEFSLPADRGYLPDLAAISGDIVSQAKLIYLNYPNNPTGAVATLDFFKQVVDFARETGILVAHECSYSEIAFDGYRPPSILQIEGARDVAVEIHSLSSMFNMGGWRIAFAAGSADAIQALNRLKSHVDRGQFGALSLAAGWALTHESNNTDLAVLQGRRNALVDGLNGLGWNLDKPKASPYVWAPVPPGFTASSFSEALLTRAAILTIPGPAFGAGGEGFVRASISATGNEKQIQDAIDRIAQNISLNWQ